MVLEDAEITEILTVEKNWLVFLEENGKARPLGQRAMPMAA